MTKSDVVSSTSPSAIGSSPSASGAAKADTATVTAAVRAYVKAEGGNVSVAVYDRATGASISVNGTAEYQTASIVKVDIIAALMLQHQDAGTSLTAQEKQWAAAAIERSDNDSASALFDAIGGTDGLAAANERLGLTETTPSDAWGMTTTTADDQVRLLKKISDGNGPLSAANRGLLQGWMSNVVSEQRFGVTAGADDAATAVYLKVGWVDLDDENGQYATNSIGRIVEDGHDWVIAVLSDHNDTFDAGKSVVNGTAAKAIGELRQAFGSAG
ncbi:serine hydrolase [Hamadaea tsunoensis]|uniref:serine hydrolase n=1 Tax=Hamadaea tsunoensis TaxID=53368 RepID=UPI00146FAB75|nr:serine hydrolase [Hamadaea tsunoensis]